MHEEILNQDQTSLLSLVNDFSKQGFGLVGGTAIALQIGHRRSIDFDLFSLTDFENSDLKRIIQERNLNIEVVYIDELNQYTVSIGGVRFTFLYYPFPIKFTENFKNLVQTPDLLTLAAMKAYALGRRAKWKDYVDLFFIIKNHCQLTDIEEKSKEIFKREFNQRIFKEQLAYFDDINYSEIVDFLPGFEVSNEEIKSFLLQKSL
ncbi:MAG: hypothetical protein COU06_00695 [Candidatus Harrisonbacteria bacterium CG10_big_fil_rev_8_21_14_0_10_38_8]|uniref:Nucleotidyl transferase AbiEii/AbiGii toxin family protein n=1 Tax=Candidatus Harrisonbacteria bacterium CG10_big_fil_rev_8_21_14_0_10_38_8 TaxID=1974582 RepID=A0A2M6WKK1_9BACT|nr:MAG: hypothetical protein COU06_00695 [Candidatus Harrisonbacteria bacterium CG10_big_fil_rev_8_21_14_0_10_38_8]